MRLCVLTLGNASPRVYFTDSQASLENSGPAEPGIHESLNLHERLVMQHLQEEAFKFCFLNS